MRHCTSTITLSTTNLDVRRKLQKDNYPEMSKHVFIQPNTLRSNIKAFSIWRKDKLFRQVFVTKSMIKMIDISTKTI